MKQIIFPIVLTIVFLTIDWLAFRAIKEMFRLKFKRFWTTITVFYWIPAMIMVSIMVFILFKSGATSGRPPEWIFSTMIAVFVISASKITLAFFHLLSSIFHFLKRVYFRWFKDQSGDSGVTRAQFLNQLGLGASAVLFSSFVYGMVKGKYNFQVRKEQLPVKNLPDNAKSLRIVQISDSHLGTFGEEGVDEVEAAINLVNDLNPDLVFFTGDLVNNIAEEAFPFIELFAKIESRLGKYSILGNHDYAEYYYRGDSPEMLQKKRENLIALEEVHQKMGFKLLRNQNVILGDGDDKISIIGVENWGRNFFQFGDLKKAMIGVPDNSLKILLSHDPTHFEEQVMGKQDIFLTLSGHTHGAQFGVEVPDWGLKWSPSAWFGYKRWGGLYQEGSQFLYVNRGLGCLGFPGRVGIMPEITCIDLHVA